MVCFDSSIFVDQHIGMAKSVKNSTIPSLKLKQINHSHKNNRTSTSLCEQSRYAIIDVIILFAVIIACGFLLYPCANVFAHKTIELGEEVVDLLTEEFFHAPMVFGCLGLSILFAAMALVAITVYTDSTCGKPGCCGLRKGAEFDIELETKETVKKSTWIAKNAIIKKGLFELSCDHYRELEAELKKMAPTNGKAVLVFRGRCGCSVGRMEVLGPRKTRKVKK